MEIISNKMVISGCMCVYVYAIIVTDVLDKLRIIVRWYVATYLIFMGTQLNIKVEYHMD